MMLLERLLDALDPPRPAKAPDFKLDALNSAADSLKVSTGLATGALVFSVGLLPSVETAGLFVRLLLTMTWVMLLFAIVGGILSQTAIPTLIYEANFDMKARNFTWPWRVHQVLFAFAILGLAIVLTVTLNAAPAPALVAGPAQAVERARVALHAGEIPDRLDSVDLVKGADDARGAPGAWHVRFHLRPRPGSGDSTVDVLVDSRKGTICRIPM